MWRKYEIAVILTKWKHALGYESKNGKSPAGLKNVFVYFVQRGIMSKKAGDTAIFGAK